MTLLPRSTSSGPAFAEDLKANKNGGKVHTRFPPEPNGYLHIGHAKALCLDLEIRAENNGLCNLRFDDTNPDKETVEFEENIMRDIRWLGFDWGDRLYYASDYFEKFYECAVQLIKEGKAYVEDLSADQIREYRGTLTEPGRNSPFRDRSITENLDPFHSHARGRIRGGQRILRAKIDMTSGNLNMRDPALYRIKKVSHYRAGDKWCIYPCTISRIPFQMRSNP
jgi:glutaminyl-tRNA synthetase